MANEVIGVAVLPLEIPVMIEVVAPRVTTAEAYHPSILAAPWARGLADLAVPDLRT